VFASSVKTGLLSVLKFLKLCETEDQTAVAVFDGPGNFQSWAVLGSLGPVQSQSFFSLETGLPSTRFTQDQLIRSGPMHDKKP